MRSLVVLRRSSRFNTDVRWRLEMAASYTRGGRLWPDLSPGRLTASNASSRPARARGSARTHRGAVYLVDSGGVPTRGSTRLRCPDRQTKRSDEDNDHARSQQ